MYVVQIMYVVAQTLFLKRKKMRNMSSNRYKLNSIVDAIRLGNNHGKREGLFTLFINGLEHF